MRFRKLLAFLLLGCVFFSHQTVLAGLGSRKVAYREGTIPGLYNGPNGPVEGTLRDTETDLVFTPDDKKKADKVFRIPYKSITEIEYGQKAGRRLGAAVATAVLINPAGLFLLFRKKRKHFMTVSWTDGEGKEQVAVLELGKDIIRETLAVTKTKSGKEIIYQDEEAKKSSKG